MEKDKTENELQPVKTDVNIEPAQNKEEEIRAMLVEIVPGDMNDADVLDMTRYVVERAKKDAEMNQRLVDAFSKEPRLAKVFQDLVKGEKSAAYNFAKFFGKDFAAYEEGTPEYEDFMAGEEERLSEIKKAEDAKDLLDKNLDESEIVIDEYCKANNLDADEFRAKIDAILMPILDGVISKETCKALDRAVNYENDTKDAYDAGVIEGRNTNINAMRDDKGDGLPKGLGSQKVQDKKKKPSNSLIALAMEA